MEKKLEKSISIKFQQDFKEGKQLKSRTVQKKNTFWIGLKIEF